ncbi:hypothetical protein NPM20_25335, partial [Vibrio parahaemolyticus]
VAAVDGDGLKNRAAARVGSLLRHEKAGHGCGKRRAGQQGRFPVETSRGFAVSAWISIFIGRFQKLMPRSPFSRTTLDA